MRTALLALALLATGCDVSGRVEAEIAEALPEALGPADRYDVDVADVSLASRTAGRVTITGARVARADAPVVDRLDATLWGVAADADARRLTRVDSARATARLRPDDLARYLEGRGGISEAALALAAPDRATVRVRGAIEGVRLPIATEVRGRLRASGGVLRLEVAEVRAAGIGLGGRAARAVGERVNPLVDLRDETLPLRVTGVRIEGGAVVVEVVGALRER